MAVKAHQIYIRQDRKIHGEPEIQVMMHLLFIPTPYDTGKFLVMTDLFVDDPCRFYFGMHVHPERLYFPTFVQEKMSIINDVLYSKFMFAG